MLVPKRTGSLPLSRLTWCSVENGIRGISVRDDFAESSCPCESDRVERDEGCPATGNYAEGLEGSDVFILGGRHERYGDKAAWKAVRR